MAASIDAAGMKRCFKCGVEKPRAEFYAHPAMSDGLLGKCKSCAKYDVALNRKRNPKLRKYDSAAQAEYDRSRSRLEHRIETMNRSRRKWSAKHPERVRATRIAQHAINSGRIIRANACQACGTAEARLEKHHRDYSKPTEIEWLCKRCHVIADVKRRQAEGL